jgi:hypothetical protein
LVQGAGNQNASGRMAVKYHVPSVLHTPQSGADIITGAAQPGIIGEHPATRLKIIDVTNGLVYSPSAKGISSDRQQVGFGAPREPEEGHG